MFFAPKKGLIIINCNINNCPCLYFGSKYKFGAKQHQNIFRNWIIELQICKQNEYFDLLYAKKHVRGTSEWFCIKKNKET